MFHEGEDTIDVLPAMVMYGTKIDYVVQRRLQDYWIDCYESTFKYKDQAESRMKSLMTHSPHYDFRLVKRTSSYVDELVEEKTD